MRISKFSLALISATLIVMLLALPLTLSSGAITGDAHWAYEDEAYHSDSDSQEDRDEDAENASRFETVGILASAAMSDILPVNDISALPIDTSPGNTPIAANFTENGYRDDTIIVEMEQRRMFESDVFIAYVKIATASQLRTAYAGNNIKSTRTNLTSRLSKNYNGIVAINGDYYSDGKKHAGYVIRQKEVYREKTSANMDLLLIDEMGDFHIMLRGMDEQKAAINEFLEEHEIINGFFFGPALVIDGEIQEIPKNYEWSPNAANPRTAIGQTGPLTYVLVTVNGRTDASRGVAFAELAQIMEELGAKQAYNLDGGNSATLAFNGEVYNDKPQDERAISDIIYFATATEQGE